MMSSKFKCPALVAVTLAGASMLLSGCSQSDEDSLAESGNSDSVVHLRADYPQLNNLDDVVQASDAIVTVEFVSARNDVIYPEMSDSDDPVVNPQAGVELSESAKADLGVPVTISTVKVTESVKGDLPVGSLLDVSQVGGQMDGVQYDEEQTLLLGDVADADRLLLFVNVYEDGKADLVSASAGVLTEDAHKLRQACTSDGRCGDEVATRLPDVERAVQRRG